MFRARAPAYRYPRICPVTSPTRPLLSQSHRHKSWTNCLNSSVSRLNSSSNRPNSSYNRPSSCLINISPTGSTEETRNVEIHFSV